MYSMRLNRNSSKPILYAFALAIGVLCGPSAFAQETQVSCKAPVLQLATGGDGTTARATILCTGGASVGGVSTPYVYYAYAFPSNPWVAQAIVQAVGMIVRQLGSNETLTILSNFSVLGTSIGCGADNCRLINYVYGL
jgi:hypothetical protein